MKRLTLGLFFCCLAFGQKPDPAVTFEVASVKPSPPQEGNVRRRIGCNGGPGTPSPGQYTCSNATINMMVIQAFGLKSYQFTTANLMDGATYDVTAKIPPDSTAEQVKMMIQNLLIERFKLAYHFEKKETQVYDLVLAKSGPKLKESAPAPPPSADGAPPPPPPSLGKMTMGPDGCPQVPPRAGGSMMMSMNGRLCMIAFGAPIDRIVSILAGQLAKPVTDLTGLKGKYDFTLSFASDNFSAGRGGAAVSVSGDGSGTAPMAADAPEPAPSLFVAVQEQLGLKLEQKKGTFDWFVIDHVEKAPTEN